MGLTLGSLDQYLDEDDTLDIPINGVEYKIPPASAELGLWCQRLAMRVDATVDGDIVTAGGKAADEAERIPLPPGTGKGTPFEVVLLSQAVVDAMVADGVTWPQLRYCAVTAFWRVVGGDDIARRYYEAGGDPNALRPAENRTERRAAAKTTRPKASGSKTTSTAGAATTRTRASGTATTSRTKSATSGPVSRSRGTKS